MVIVWLLLFHVYCVHLNSGEIVNAALRKPVNASSILRFEGAPKDPTKTVDGITIALYPDSIMHTDINQPDAWWTVDLQTEVQYATVKLYFRTDRKIYRIGVQLYTSPTPFSSYPDGQSCYNVTGRRDGTDIPDVIRVNCTGIWRYLMVYTNTNNDPGPMLDFGEVEVLVCSIGTYGINCDKSCSSRQCAGISTSCDRYTGKCIDGCKAGWTKADCTECSPGVYGSGCDMSCSFRHCCNLSTSCDPVTGTCPGGCRPGYRQVDCTQQCPPGTYGPDCNSSCGNCTGDDICEHDTGNCPSGCRPGWQGLQCKRTCDREHYGADCTRTCAGRHCVTLSTCNSSTGECHGGCQEGWTGTDCMETSSPATVDHTPIVAGAVAAAGVLILIVIIGVVVWRRRRRSESKSTLDHVYCNTANPDVTDKEPGYKTRQSLPVGSCESAEAMSGDDVNIYTTIGPVDQEGVFVSSPKSDVSAREPVSGKTYETLTSTSHNQDGDYTGLDTRSSHENVM